MQCDAMRCDGGWAAGQTGKPVHMLTELKPALWGTSSLSHPLTGSLAELVMTSVGAPIGHSGACRGDAPEAVLHGNDSSCSRCEPHVSNLDYCCSIARISASVGI